MTLFKNPYMELALQEAAKAGERGEVPVGAVLVNAKEDKVISSCGNSPRALNDPTAHAEILAIREGCRIMGSERLPNHDLYVTLEPCPMCAQAISFARIRRLYYGASDAKGGGVENGPRIFSSPSCHHKPEIYGGINTGECGEILQAFFKARRV